MQSVKLLRQQKPQSIYDPLQQVLDVRQPLDLHDDATVRSPVCQREEGPPYLLHHHPELGLPAENGLDARQPLHVGEDLGRTDQNLARVEAVGLIEEQPLTTDRNNSVR